MDYKKYLEDNKPFLISESMPFFKDFCKTKNMFYISLSLAIVIFLAFLVFLIFQDNKSVNKILISRESTLNAKLTRLENINEMLEAEILLSRNEVKSLARKKDKKKLAKISKYLADTIVTDKGLEIIMSDNNSIFASAQDEMNVIHNTDLLKFVNFLWSKNATAISINGERITPQTAISCVGPTIIINQKRITSPFTIKASGKNFNIEEIKNDAFVLSLKLRGIELEISEKDEILVPAGKYVTLRD